VLSVGAQGEEVVAWARCDSEAPTGARTLGAVPTGVALPPWLEGALFVGTVQRSDGLVFHAFDGGERDATDVFRSDEAMGAFGIDR
jgi:hypothetical protein